MYLEDSPSKIHVSHRKLFSKVTLMHCIFEQRIHIESFAYHKDKCKALKATLPESLGQKAPQLGL